MAARMALAAAAALAVGPAAAGSTGAEVWSTAGCGGCHALAAAGSTGTAGPDLDDERPSAHDVAVHVTRGGGGMPAFGGVLSQRQISAVAAYVEQAARRSRARPVTGSSELSVQQVVSLQQRLKKLDLFRGIVTGFYGKSTIAAVRRFQAAHGLAATGTWNARSETVLRRLLRHR